MSRKKPFNPFYTLLIPVGTLFVITAFVYGYMAFQLANAVREEAGVHAEHPLFAWMRAHGNAALLVELGALAVLTIGAMVLEARRDAKDDARTDDKNQ